jgi:hypothetical protein
MSHHQYKLFDYTRASKLLTGKDVIKATNVKRLIKILQSQGKVEKDWKLDIYCRDPTAITDLIVSTIDPSSAASSYGAYGIAIVLHNYTLTAAWFKTEQEAIKVLDTVRAYITHRYGV